MSLGLSAVALPGAKPEARRYFFDVSPLKLVVMSFFTLGLYQVYWFYKNWKLAKERGEDVNPVLRAIFSIFFINRLLKNIVETGRQASVEVSTRPAGLTTVFILLCLAWRLPDPFWLLGYASVIPLAIAQADVVKVHRALGLDPAINNRFTWKNILGIVIGGIFHTLTIIGLFLPHEPA